MARFKEEIYLTDLRDQVNCLFRVAILKELEKITRQLELLRREPKQRH